MKSNIQNQRGYALFIVMGLMVLATIGVMATYKAASSYDEKSGTSFKNRGAKEVTEAGTRAVESYLTDNAMDALGVLQQMYFEKITDSLNVMPVELSLNSLNKSNLNFKIYFVDVEWRDPSMFLKTKIVGFDARTNDTVRTAQNVMFKVDGLDVDILGYVNGIPQSSVCMPDFALYLGGGQSANITKNLYVNGGLYSTRLQINNGNNLNVEEGGITLGNPSGGTNNAYGNMNLDSGSFFSGHSLDWTSATNPLFFDGDAEFEGNFSTKPSPRTIHVDIEVKDDLTLRNWTSSFNGSRTVDVKGDLKIIGDLNYTNESNTSTVRIKVGGNAEFRGELIDTEDGTPRIHFEIGGKVIFHDEIKLDDQGGIGDTIYVAGDEVVYLAPIGTFPSSYVRCLSAPGEVCTVLTSIPSDYFPEITSVVNEMNLDTANNYVAPVDIQISDSMLTKKLSWSQMWQKGIDEGILSGSVPASYDLRFRVNVANQLSGDDDFVDKYGFNGFLIVDMDSDSRSITEIYGKGYDNSHNTLLQGNWVLYNRSESGDFSSLACLPENDPSSRVLIWSLASSFRFTTCDSDSDGQRRFYGFLWVKGAGNNFLSSKQNIYGSVYTDNGNANAITASNGNQDSIWLRQDVLQDLGPVGLLKLNNQGDTIMNCITGADSTGVVPVDSSTFVEIDRILQSRSSQLTVKRVGNLGEMKIDEIMGDMESASAETMLPPFVGFSQSTVTISNGVFSDFGEMMDSLKFKGFYQFKGSRNGCSTKWDGGDSSSIDISSFADTTIGVEFSVSCPNSRVVSKKMKLVIGGGTGSNGTSTTSSSTGNASSSAEVSSVAASSVAASSTAGSSTPLSSSALAVDPSCAIYPLWDPSVSYAKDEYVRGNAGQVYSCVASDLTDCSKVFSSGGSDANGIWFYQGTCTVNLEQDTISWITPVHNREYTLGDVVNFEWYNSTTENVNISFKLDGDADWTTNAYSTGVATSKTGSYSWKFETGTGEGEGTMYFKIELESTVGISNVVAVTVKAASSDVCDGVEEHSSAHSWSVGDYSQKSNKLYECNSSTSCQWNAPGSSFWDYISDCGVAASSTNNVSSVANSSAAISSVAASSAASACSGYDTFVGGVSSPSNGEKYVYDGSLWLAKNNPGTWEVPAEGWFWSKVTTCN